MGGKAVVVVVVTVVTTRWIAGPNEKEPTVESSGGMGCGVVVDVVVLPSCPAMAGLPGGTSSAGEAGAVERIASGACCVCIPKPRLPDSIAFVDCSYMCMLSSFTARAYNGPAVGWLRRTRWRMDSDVSRRNTALFLRAPSRLRSLEILSFRYVSR